MPLPRRPERLDPGELRARLPGVAERERLLDHLVGSQQNRGGYGKPKRLGGLAVYDHLELGWKLHREIARLRAAQDTIDIDRKGAAWFAPVPT
jgi:hypothetical protein